MGIGTVKSSELDLFVAKIDELGGPASADAVAYWSDFELTLDTKVDQSLDPFSESYVSQQFAVYGEIAGRILDQHKFEQSALDPTALFSTSNPYGSKDTHFIAKHCRAVLASVSLANLPPGPSILDMGCGWGLSSEMFAYCGATVTGVDINPQFVELVNARRKGRHFDIEAHLSEFDAFHTDKKFDMVFFYECLHHAIKPWETLKKVAGLVNETGKIVIAGEPINDFWWKDWGIRLDPLSVYCIRKYGWFENGWSAAFLAKCFEYAGMSLELFPMVGLDGGAIGVGTLPDLGHGSPHLKPRLDLVYFPDGYREKYEALQLEELQNQARFEALQLRYEALRMEAALAKKERDDFAEEARVLQKKLGKASSRIETLTRNGKEIARSKAKLRDMLRHHSANPLRALRLWWKRPQL